MSSGASVSANHAAYHNIAVVRFVLLLSTFNYVTLQFPLKIVHVWGKIV